MTARVDSAAKDVLLVEDNGWLQDVISEPEMHRWQHGREPRERANFATKFAV